METLTYTAHLKIISPHHKFTQIELNKEISAAMTLNQTLQGYIYILIIGWQIFLQLLIQVKSLQGFFHPHNRIQLLFGFCPLNHLLFRIYYILSKIILHSTNH